MIVKYPKTSCHKPVGHLFEISPVEWVQPKLSFAYSLGAPMGQVETWNGQPIYCNLLVDKDGEWVPCQVSHATCKPKLLFFLLNINCLLAHIKTRDAKYAVLQILHRHRNPIWVQVVTTSNSSWCELNLSHLAQLSMFCLKKLSPFISHISCMDVLVLYQMVNYSIAHPRCRIVIYRTRLRREDKVIPQNLHVQASWFSIMTIKVAKPLSSMS